MKKTIVNVMWTDGEEEYFDMKPGGEPGFKDGVLSFTDAEDVLIILPLCNINRVDVYVEDE